MASIISQGVIDRIYAGDAEEGVPPSTVGGLSKSDCLLFASVIEEIKEALARGGLRAFREAVEWAFLEDYEDIPSRGTLAWFAAQLGWNPDDLRRLLFRNLSEKRKASARRLLASYTYTKF